MKLPLLPTISPGRGNALPDPTSDQIGALPCCGHRTKGQTFRSCLHSRIKFLSNVDCNHNNQRQQRGGCSISRKSRDRNKSYCRKQGNRNIKVCPQELSIFCQLFPRGSRGKIGCGVHLKSALKHAQCLSLGPIPPFEIMTKRSSFFGGHT